MFYSGGFKAQANIDAGYYFCPYIPGLSEEENAARFAHCEPTQFQTDVFRSVSEQPMLKHRLKEAL